MIFHTRIRKTLHYKLFHERAVPFDEVIRILYSTKSQRKKGDKIVVDTGEIYLLCRLKNNTLYIINAKRK